MRILITGMSITQGFHDDELGGWANRMHIHEVNKAITSDFSIGHTVFSLGISGDCTNRLLERFSVEAAARLRDPEDLIIFDIGVNDTQRFNKTEEIKTPKDVFKANLEKLVSQAKKHTQNIAFVNIAPVIETMLQPMPWASDRSHFEKDVTEYRQIIKTICEEQNCLEVSLDGVYGSEESDILHDGIHPNSEGHRLIFERVKSVLEAKGLL